VAHVDGSKSLKSKKEEEEEEEGETDESSLLFYCHGKAD
jgi:hypothetical protein